MVNISDPHEAEKLEGLVQDLPKILRERFRELDKKGETAERIAAALEALCRNVEERRTSTVAKCIGILENQKTENPTRSKKRIDGTTALPTKGPRGAKHNTGGMQGYQ